MDGKGRVGNGRWKMEDRGWRKSGVGVPAPSSEAEERKKGAGRAQGAERRARDWQNKEKRELTD
jgi:hypothetical protein